jgi:dephospho-CoA kinase
MSIIIGITGGIGSGKTTVAKMFQNLGIPVYNSDLEAKRIMKLPELILNLKNKFGSDYLENGTLNRKKLADTVFNNAEKLMELNSIVHPFVKIDFMSWIKNNGKNKLLIKESAILFESKANLDCDKIITVVAPLDLRIQRIIDRDNLNYDAIIKRMTNQSSDKIKSEKSDFVIENTDLELTKKQVLSIYKILNL